MKTSFEIINNKFKIPKIKQIQSIDTSNVNNLCSQTNYPAITISQKEMFHTFADLTILFIGDNSMRTLYRDFVKIFSSGHLLDKTEAAMQHGEYRETNGEIRLQQGGQRGTSEYKDIRQYFCQSSSTKLIYIHLATVFGDSTKRNIDYLKAIPNCTSIHVVLFSLYHGDFNL